MIVALMGHETNIIIACGDVFNTSKHIFGWSPNREIS